MESNQPVRKPYFCETPEYQRPNCQESNDVMSRQGLNLKNGMSYCLRDLGKIKGKYIKKKILLNEKTRPSPASPVPWVNHFERGHFKLQTSEEGKDDEIMGLFVPQWSPD